jgi:hypothetical protein
MRSEQFRKIVFAMFVSVLAVAVTGAQPNATPKYSSQEISEIDGVPVLLKHLPDWENVRESAVFATNSERLKAALGDRPVIDLIDFTAGTEAATAQYEAGKLLIVEYTSSQLSIAADEKFSEILVGDSKTAYRRIGNYNAFVFDVTDEAAANALLDHVKYEKQIQWLGDNPFRISAERAFVLTISDIFFSTFLWILLGMCVALLGGTIAGLLYFRRSRERRAHLTTFSDAGGMTRLNLDGFTPEIQPERLLGE